MTANGNYQGFYGCSFLGFQDTLYAKAGQQYYKRCYMEGIFSRSARLKIILYIHTDLHLGSVDFIFGDAAAWFGVCTDP